MCLGGACLGRGADLAPSAGRCRGGGGLSAGCGLHASGPGPRLALGPADVGHLLGLGGAPQLIPAAVLPTRSEEHTSELQSLMRISYAVFCLKKKKRKSKNTYTWCSEAIY